MVAYIQPAVSLSLANCSMISLSLVMDCVALHLLSYAFAIVICSFADWFCSYLIDRVLAAQQP